MHLQVKKHQNIVKQELKLAFFAFRLYNRNMSQPRLLYNLQQLDNKIDNAHARLGEIEIDLADHLILNKANSQAKAAERSFTKAQKAQKNAGLEVETQQTKISNNERTTYSGSVTNPKELEDLQMEAEALKRHLVVLEDKMLDMMLAFEEAEALHNSAQAHLADAKEQDAISNSSLSAEKTSLLAKLEKLEIERVSLVATMDPESIKIYEKLRKTKNGFAVAEVIEKSCSACGVNLTAAQALEARSPNKITSCESCRRILYSG